MYLIANTVQGMQNSKVAHPIVVMQAPGQNLVFEITDFSSVTRRGKSVLSKRH